MKKPLPIGVDNFEKLISNHYYYVDKTMWIKQLLDLKGEVNLFMRPRRFGKTLNLSMLQYFFEDTGNHKQNKYNYTLFNNMKILQAGTIYTDKMNQYPVISLTMKSGKQDTFFDSYFQLKELIAEEFMRHKFLFDNNILEKTEMEKYTKLASGTAEKETYYTSLKYLSYCLYKATKKRVIILLDEYDVPLENAYLKGFYNEMTGFIRSLFESALKSNQYLEFAVITGCLRITKESIFTGLNHLNIISVLNKQYSEHFGFTEKEVLEMLSYYNVLERYDDIRNWYDGYTFGDTNLYNPWSVIKFIYDLNIDKAAFPRPYWANTSSNDIVKKLIHQADRETREQIETLLTGKSIDIFVHEEITYEDMEKNREHIWNILYFTGYLTKLEERFEDRNIVLKVVIPNEELKSVYENLILSWFKESIEKRNFNDLYQAMEEGNTKKIEDILNQQLMSTISFYDNAENFYHGFLAGILNQSKEYIVKSNREFGLGRNDLMIYSPNIAAKAFVLELKVTDKYKELDLACETALQQIKEKQYTIYLEDIGYENITCYAIAFFRKNCRVKKI